MNGGESVYLGRAYGSLVAFIFEFITIMVQKVTQKSTKLNCKSIY